MWKKVLIILIFTMFFSFITIIKFDDMFIAGENDLIEWNTYRPKDYTVTNNVLFEKL